MSEPKRITLPRHPLRSQKLSGAEVGWFRPALAVVLGLLILPWFALVLTLNGAPTIAGPPKDGSGYSFSDHIAIVLACLSVSFIATWMAAPVALLALRAAAMLGWAGWASAMGAAVILGLPMAHWTLNGDLTTDVYAVPVQLSVAIALLGLSIWAAFWGSLMVWQPKVSE